MTKTILIYKYHITTSDEFQRENGEQIITFAAFTNSIENEMLGVQWINPIEGEDILISDIVHIKHLGTEKIQLDTEMGEAHDKEH